MKIEDVVIIEPLPINNLSVDVLFDFVTTPNISNELRDRVRDEARRDQLNREEKEQVLRDFEYQRGE
jgi:hypothetical protein